MARPEDPVDPHADSDRSPDLSDKLDQDPKLKDYDVEDQGHGRRLSQHNVTAVDASSTTESIGRQIEMESENTIKYRTCSWQKVIPASYLVSITTPASILTPALDCRPAVLRVYLSGHDVLPLVVLDPRSRARFDPDRVYSRCGLVHVVDRLVRNSSARARGGR